MQSKTYATKFALLLCREFFRTTTLFIVRGTDVVGLVVGATYRCVSVTKLMAYGMAYGIDSTDTHTHTHRAMKGERERERKKRSLNRR